MFACRDLVVVRDGVKVLDGVTVEIPAGASVGIIGPNGGGKTTLLRVLLGRHAPTSGEVRVEGDVFPAARRHLARIGYLPQRAAAMDHDVPLTVEELVATGRLALRPWWRRATADDHHAGATAMERAGVAHLARRRCSDLSGGERQRAFLARALASDPRALLLDEPTSFVDQEGQTAFFALLRELNAQGMTVVIVSHDHDALEREVQTILCLDRHLTCHVDRASAHHAVRMVHGHR